MTAFAFVWLWPRSFLFPSVTIPQTPYGAVSLSSVVSFASSLRCASPSHSALSFKSRFAILRVNAPVSLLLVLVLSIHTHKKAPSSRAFFRHSVRYSLLFRISFISSLKFRETTTTTWGREIAHCYFVEEEKKTYSILFFFFFFLNCLGFLFHLCETTVTVIFLFCRFKSVFFYA